MRLGNFVLLGVLAILNMGIVMQNTNDVFS
jgi:hypothetical protein